jgi:hypothetical protein
MAARLLSSATEKATTFCHFSVPPNYNFVSPRRGHSCKLRYSRVAYSCFAMVQNSHFASLWSEKLKVQKVLTFLSRNFSLFVCFNGSRQGRVPDLFSRPTPRLHN